MSSTRRHAPFRALLALLVTLPLSAHAAHQSVSGAVSGFPGGQGGPGASPTSGGSFLPLSCEGSGGLGCDQVAPASALDLCIDRDGDNVCDNVDECPNTPAGEPVLLSGCGLSEGSVFILRGVNFETDKSRLTPSSIEILDQAVVTLKANPEVLISIDGHTDERATNAYNLALSLRRACAVERYFINNGVADERMVYRGFGEEVPLNPASTPEAWAENRRVELSILNQDEFRTIEQEQIARNDRCGKYSYASPVANDYVEPSPVITEPESNSGGPSSSFDEQPAPGAISEPADDFEEPAEEEPMALEAEEEPAPEAEPAAAPAPAPAAQNEPSESAEERAAREQAEAEEAEMAAAEEQARKDAARDVTEDDFKEDSYKPYEPESGTDEESFSFDDLDL